MKQDKAPSVNEITGSIQSTKASTDAYRSGWDNIFGKKETKEQGSLGSSEPKGSASCDAATPSQIILINKAMCDSCREVVRSEHQHDYVSCSCGNLAVDGGTSYIKRNYGYAGFTELSFCANEDDIETIRDYFTWGSYGKNGDEPKRNILLKDLTDDHIEAILRTQLHIKGTQVERILKLEQEYRNGLKGE